MTWSIVLFDIDGTLVDSNEFHVSAWGQAFQSAGFPIPAVDIRGQIGKGADMLIPALLPEADRKTFKRIAKEHGRIFKHNFLPRVKPFPGAAQVIRDLHARGLKIVLASSAKEDEVQHYVELLDIFSALAAITSADDVEASKPAPDIFETALKKLGRVSPAQAVVVGDTPYDALAGKRVGAAVIGVRTGGFSDQSIEAAGALQIVDSVRDVPSVLR